MPDVGLRSRRGWRHWRRWGVIRADVARPVGGSVDVGSVVCSGGEQIMNRQKFVAFSSLVKGLN